MPYEIRIVKIDPEHSDKEKHPKIQSTKKAAKVGRVISGDAHEQNLVISLDATRRMITSRIVSIGGTHITMAAMSEIFRGPVMDGAAGLIFIHNHPVGSVIPSELDVKFHKDMLKACRILDIELTDDVIVSGKKYFSLMGA